MKINDSHRRWVRRNTWFSFVVFLLPALTVVLSCCMCNRSDRDRVIEVVERREEAIEKRDLDRYLECISPDYHDGRGRGYTQMEERLGEIFRRFDQMEYLPGRRYLYPYGETAVVIQEFTLRFRAPEGELTSRKGKERIVLRKEGRDWKIIDGL